MKRIFDLFLSLCLAPVLLFPLLVIALLVKLTSMGPALYWSDRVGVENEIFMMPKFKTMRIDTPAVATHLLQNPDSYLTRIGSFLRKSSLDELPQLMYNIMSAGKPIFAVSDRESELSQVISEENIEWVVQPESPDLLAQAVMEVNANRWLLHQMSVKARAAAIEKYSWPIIIRRHEDLMDNLGLHNKSFREGIE